MFATLLTLKGPLIPFYLLFVANETTGVCAGGGGGWEDVANVGTKTGALTLGTKEAALTLRPDIFELRSPSISTRICSQCSHKGLKNCTLDKTFLTSKCSLFFPFQ